MQYRTLGRTGLDVSEVGFGGTGVGMKNYLHVLMSCSITVSGTRKKLCRIL